MTRRKSTHKRKSMSRRRNSVRVNIRTKRNKQSKRMKKTKRMKRNNNEKRGGFLWFGRRRQADEIRNRPGLARRSLTRFRNYMNRNQRLAEQAEEQARFLEQQSQEEEERLRQEEEEDEEERQSKIRDGEIIVIGDEICTANNLQLVVALLRFANLNGLNGRGELRKIVGSKWDEKGEGTTREKLLQILRINNAPTEYDRDEITPIGSTDGVVNIINDEDYRAFISSPIFD